MITGKNISVLIIYFFITPFDAGIDSQALSIVLLLLMLTFFVVLELKLKIYSVQLLSNLFVFLM